ncbi:NRDE family protein [Accumulibacter sp.]|uniref:NRDE family protein n=1 Tax=Accumulibacter sp. TaxID=2053492 RepID=UPI0025E4E0F2|nr:NRDE family protein [Accumulibacter sp.]MCM8594573.1 NRDE family protein [Accumulibacter sp.]MCM8627421.1 NRDE family protein [Accumulibacter sp.]MDS4048719.1 NRDE family protein [Accumulibacter sp.]
MCLILVAWQAHPDYPLVVAANRDEFFSRPAAPAAFWDEAPQVLAGRDLEAGGTWLGVSRGQRFAALTNYREGGRQVTGAPSRGALVAEFLTGGADPGDYLAQVDRRAAQYNGFNLFAGDGDRLAYLSNRSNGGIRWLPPGIYGLSNHLLDTPWPKLASARAAFAEALAGLPAETRFFELLADDEIVPDAHLPETGVPLAWERILSAVFVRSPNYGTRASTLLTRHRDGRILLRERSFDAAAQPAGEVCEAFQSAEMSTSV